MDQIDLLNAANLRCSSWNTVTKWNVKRDFCVFLELNDASKAKTNTTRAKNADNGIDRLHRIHVVFSERKKNEKYKIPHNYLCIKRANVCTNRFVVVPLALFSFLLHERRDGVQAMIGWWASDLTISNLIYCIWKSLLFWFRGDFCSIDCTREYIVISLIFSAARCYLILWPFLLIALNRLCWSTDRVYSRFSFQYYIEIRPFMSAKMTSSEMDIKLA